MSKAPAIRFQGRAAINGVALFDPLDLNIAAEKWTCLLGASGVGKTTILRLIAGLDSHTEFAGTITANDGLPLPPRLAYMAQDDLLLPWANLRDNVALGARLRGQGANWAVVDRLIASVGLTQHADKKPAQLSGGQRQRAALARTLAEDKPVILLDEPFSALDAKTRSEMQDLAAKLLAGKTVLLITHDPGEAARLAHAIAVITPAGLTWADVPAGTAPRAVDDTAVLAAQGALLKFLREGAKDAV